jgi:hypothetical protein
MPEADERREEHCVRATAGVGVPNTMDVVVHRNDRLVGPPAIAIFCQLFEFYRSMVLANLF